MYVGKIYFVIIIFNLQKLLIIERSTIERLHNHEKRLFSLYIKINEQLKNKKIIFEFGMARIETKTKSLQLIKTRFINDAAFQLFIRVLIRYYIYYLFINNCICLLDFTRTYKTNCT